MSITLQFEDSMSKSPQIPLNSQMFTPSGMSFVVRKLDLPDYDRAFFSKTPLVVCSKRPTMVPGNLYLDGMRRFMHVDRMDVCMELENVFPEDDLWVRLQFKKVGVYDLQGQVALMKDKYVTLYPRIVVNNKTEPHLDNRILVCYDVHLETHPEKANLITVR